MGLFGFGKRMEEVQEDETEAVEETSEKAAEESEAVMLQKAAAEQMQSIAGIVKPDADEDEDDFAERQMQTPEEMLMHMDLGQHTEKEESELEKEVGKANQTPLGLRCLSNVKELYLS